MNTYSLTFSANTFFDINTKTQVGIQDVIELANKFVQFWIDGMPFHFTDEPSHVPLVNFTYKLGPTDSVLNQQTIYFDATIETLQSPNELAHFTQKCRRHTTIPFAAQGFTTAVILGKLTDIRISKIQQVIPDCAPIFQNPFVLGQNDSTTPSTELHLCAARE